MSEWAAGWVAVVGWCRLVVVVCVWSVCVDFASSIQFLMESTVALLGFAMLIPTKSYNQTSRRYIAGEECGRGRTYGYRVSVSTGN